MENSYSLVTMSCLRVFCKVFRCKVMYSMYSCVQSENHLYNESKTLSWSLIFSDCYLPLKGSLPLIRLTYRGRRGGGRSLNHPLPLPPVRQVGTVTWDICPVLHRKCQSGEYWKENWKLCCCSGSFCSEHRTRPPHPPPFPPICLPVFSLFRTVSLP
jgi:hypothetical protein